MELVRRIVRNWQMVKCQRRTQVGSERVVNTSMTPAVRDLRASFQRQGRIRPQNETVWARVRGVQKSQ